MESQNYFLSTPLDERKCGSGVANFGYCHVCRAEVWLDTDRQGRLLAYEKDRRRLHPHPEAALGEAVWQMLQAERPKRKATRFLPDVSEDIVRKIATSMESIPVVVERYGVKEHQVKAIRQGRYKPLCDIDYAAIAAKRQSANSQRSGKLGRIARDTRGSER
jgi:hypothetical protein